MCGSSVSLMLCEPILRVLLIILFHHVVPGDLCEDARRRDGNALRIALDDRHLRDRNLRDRHRIVSKDLGRRVKFRDRLAHRLISRLQDVDLIDPLRTHDPHRPGDRFLLDLQEQFLSPALRELFRVV